MKIALVAPTAMPALRANTIQVAKMAQALVSLGHAVRLAAPGLPPEGGYSWEAWQRHYGLRWQFPVEWLPSRPALRRYDYALHALRWSGGWSADLVYTRLPQAAALGSLMGVPLVLEMHDFPASPGARLMLSAFLRGRGARRLVAVTQRLADDLAARFPIPQRPGFTLVAADGVDLERYQDLPSPPDARVRLRAAGLPLEERFTAGYTGHLYPGRGIELLLEIAVKLPQVTFLVVGGEPQEVDKHSAQARQRGLSNVVFTGFVPNADLPLYQAACEALLMPYQHQVAASSGGNIAAYLSPMKAFEYLACGRAILCSDLPVLGEVLNARNALLLPPEHPLAWEAALRELLTDPERRAALGQAARQDAPRYSWEERARRLVAGLEA
ncbi:MAG: glycosyltransferase family 4 protein [Anaerolineales bacterium]|nr:glycosyltransferase family 4 protein [Anaerolineales bacterium]